MKHELIMVLFSSRFPNGRLLSEGLKFDTKKEALEYSSTLRRLAKYRRKKGYDYVRTYYNGTGYPNFLLNEKRGS